MKTVCLIACLLLLKISFGQPVAALINRTVNQLGQDSQFEHAIMSMYVADAKTGKTIYEKNAAIGLAPASCQKIVTSAAAFELLGKTYRYNTFIKTYKTGDSTFLFIDANGDPTLGSWRWDATKMEKIYNYIYTALRKKNISALGAHIGFQENKFSFQPIPDGWVWQDIGNYYGAGAWAFNWHENQYDLVLSSGNSAGDITRIKSFDPASAEMSISNFISTGKKGSGDNAYIYSAPYSNAAFATGTIPPGQDKFSISGSMPDPSLVFVKGLKAYLHENDIKIPDENAATKKTADAASELLYTLISPSLDSINYWFLKKSVNLFGEAFVKTISYEKTGYGSTDTGISIIKDFWDKKGISRSALNIIDGSGLSPANRITTKALVSILQYAKGRPWFDSFYNALPEMNGIKMKDGYIGGVRSYAGYIKSKSGTEYIFSFIVNNFDGNPGTVREKIWKLLDVLK